MRVFLGFVVAVVCGAVLVGCEEAENRSEILNVPTADNMLEVDGDHLRIIRVDDDGEKAAIAVGESDTRWCDITVNSDVLSTGAAMNSFDGSGKGLSAECQWDSDYFVQSSKHHTSVAFNLTGNRVTADFLLVNPSNGNYLALTGSNMPLPTNLTIQKMGN